MYRNKMSKEERLLSYKVDRKNPKGPIKRLYSMKEAAFYLGRTVDALREMVWAGKLPYFRDGRRMLLDIKDLDEFIDRNKQIFNF
jgi:excisionase family DNA binding protein